MIAASIAVGLICATFLVAYRWHLDARPKDETLSDLEDRIDDAQFKLAHLPESAPPPCTRDEFAKVVTQLNTVTKDMELISQTADSLRSAMGMQNMMRGKT